MSTLGIIIPTRQEERWLPGCLDCLGHTGAPVVVADGGSTDGTRRMASAHPLRPLVLDTPGGRHRQVNAALAALVTDWILVLPADARLRPGGIERIVEQCRRLRSATGCLAMWPDDRRWHHRLRGRWSGIRSRITGGAYLDQAPLFRRDAAVRVGGFRACGSYDSADLGWRLRHAGPIAILAEPVVISCREYHRGGVWRATLRHQVLRWRQLRAAVPRDARQQHPMPGAQAAPAVR
jgi:glycosyltransferase involved in cell wall biosynthesis